MSNLGPFGGNKNPPWARNTVGGTQGGMVGQTNSLQQQMLANQGSLGNMNVNPSGMVQFQQSQVFQSPIGMQQQNLSLGLQQMNQSVMTAGIGQQLTNQMYPQVGAVTYPNPRALNPTAFQTQAVSAVPPVQNAPPNPSTKQRVFTGTVTKVHDNFGFVDEDVFFQTNVCVKGSNPIVGDRVLVEASYNPNMPFKWNATRIQVLAMSGPTPSRNSSNSGNKNMYNSGPSAYNAVPPPNDSSNGNYMPSNRNSQRNKGSISSRGRDRSRSRDRDDEEAERKRRREERLREREEKEKKSPSRRRSRSPRYRRGVRVVRTRYNVQIPKIALNIPEADVLEIRRRYTNLYIPSDFFCSQFKWIEAFPPNNPFSLNKPCAFHIMHKDVDPVAENPTVLEPPDADYIFSAKVMLMSIPSMEEIYQKCCCLADDKEKKDRDSEDKDFIHPARLINFLVGSRGKNETMAIGGPWSPSLDGENPDKDPSVLIRTAIRTCRALTGIDLSHCTEWYRFVELYYRRAESTHKGRVVPARVETTTIYIPNVFNCLPTGLEWDALHRSYSKQLAAKLHTDPDGEEALANAADEKEEEATGNETGGKMEPTHYSQLDPKTMVVSALKQELKARQINCKGLRSQLVAKLTKALKHEAEKTEETSQEQSDSNAASEIEAIDEKKKDKETEEKKLDDKEKALLEKRYTLPEEPHIIVHPNRTAKSGKFDCTSMSLSLLLDYRPEDTKEHSFEVSLFAELFNEMLMRDFGFNIYKALYELPDKPKEKDEKKRKDDDRKNIGEDGDKKKKHDDRDKKDDKDRKDSKKDDKKDFKKDDDDEEFDDDDGDDDDDDKKDKRKSSDRNNDKKKKDRPKLVTKDKNLLLSFVYFDQSHCGYIFEKDIEELLYTLGLSLSRAQVRKLIGKVVTRDSLHYRKLTDKPKEEDVLDEVIVIDDSEKNSSNMDELASGNKRLLPIFENDFGIPAPKKAKTDSEGTKNDNSSEGKAAEKSSEIEGFVMYKGALIDIEKLKAQLQRSERARADTEAAFHEIKTTNAKLTEKNTKCNSTIKNLTADVKELKEKLHGTEESLSRITTCSKLFHTTLVDIKEMIEPVITNKLYSNDTSKSSSVNHSSDYSGSGKRESDVKHETNNIDKKSEDGIKSRWESIDAKPLIKSEIKEECETSKD